MLVHILITLNSFFHFQVNHRSEQNSLTHHCLLLTCTIWSFIHILNVQGQLFNLRFNAVILSCDSFTFLGRSFSSVWVPPPPPPPNFLGSETLSSIRIRVFVSITHKCKVLFKNRCTAQILERNEEEPFMVEFIRYQYKREKQGYRHK